MTALIFQLKRIHRFWRRLGPGLITGASDDDPSGITTYSIAGAQFGRGMFWTALYAWPLMSALQEMCARIGLVTGHGLSGVIRRHYGKTTLAFVAFLLVGANTLNIGADLQGMAASAALILPIPTWLLALAFSAAIVTLMIRFPYYKIANVLKWLTLSLMAYVAAAFIAGDDWPGTLAAVLIPHVSWSKEFITSLVAVLGTTISPYLFFWMASEEVEEGEAKAATTGRPYVASTADLRKMRRDVVVGMAFSNLVMFFIMAATSSVFAGHGLDPSSSISDVASALKPLAGDAAFLLFALGVVGTGFLAIPVLAGSSAYVLTEAFGYENGLSKKFHEAKAFYAIIIVSTAVGFLMTLSGYGAVFLLFLTAVVYGLVAPPLILVILHIANNRAVMGSHVNGAWSNILGFLSFALMTSAAGAMLWFSFI